MSHLKTTELIKTCGASWNCSQGQEKEDGRKALGREAFSQWLRLKMLSTP